MTQTISAEMTPAAPARPELILISRIDPNPWQTRLNDAEAHVLQIAESLKARVEADPDDPQRGLLQVPIARPHPTYPDRVQLAFGHTRLAAFKHLANADPGGERWEVFPVHVRSMGDREMAELAARENADRKDLTAIETARGLQRVITDFKLSQVEAGRMFGYSSQSAVSNLLRLLKLPEKVLDQVHDGTLPERFARQLLPLFKVAPKEASALAARLVKAENKEQELEEAMWSIRASYMAGWIRESPWGETSWPLAPIETPELASKGLPRVQACAGCEYAFQKVCLNTLCWSTKTRLFLDPELQKVSKKLGIEIAAAGEKVIPLYDGSYVNPATVRQILSTKHASLRLFLLKRNGFNTEVSRVFGNPFIGLGTVDEKALNKALPKAKPVKSWSEQERENKVKRRVAYQVRDELMKAAVPTIAAALPREPGIVDLLNKVLWRSHYKFDNWETSYGKATPADRRGLVAQLMVAELGDVNQWMPKASEVRKGVEEACAFLNVKIPAGWDGGANMETPTKKSAKRAAKEDK